jgi:sugar phosphate isomerase/epimerase
VRAALQRAGLEGPASHVPAAAVVDATERILDETAGVGCRYLVAAWIDAEQRRTVEDWNRWADRFNRVGELARARGLRFAYHNHNYEFPPVDGVVPYDVLLARTDPSLVEFEMDLYWIISAGGDPLARFAAHPGRFPLVHVKDSMGPPDHRMVDVGRGTIDFATIFARREQAGIRHWFVEHDEPASGLESARVSFQTMQRLRAP